MRRLEVLAAAFVLVAVACSSPSSTRGVRVEAVDTDIGLGVEVVLGAAPAQTVVTRPAARPADILVPLPTIPPFETAPPLVADCPIAGPFDFPAVESPPEPDPNARPVAGSYPWKLEGTVATEQGPVEIDEFEERTITNVVSDAIAPSAFRYTMKQTRLLDDRANRGSVETTYRVVPTSSASGGGTSSDVGRGVFIVSIVFTGTDSAGQPTTLSFTPSAPIQILAFPVLDGAAINSTGLDLTTFSRLTIQGQVKSKLQVDACGSRVDSWFVDAQQSFQYTDPATLQTHTIESNYDYGVGVQFGSMILFERIQAPSDIPVVDVEARVATVPERAGDG